MKALDADQIASGISAAAENASELIYEAKLLFSKNKFARAFALAYVAAEELAKLPMLSRAGVALELGGKPDWARLEKRLFRHGEKSKLFVGLLPMLAAELRESVLTDTDQEELGKLATSLTRLRFSALYSDFDGRRFTRPSQMVKKTDAEEAISLAEDHLRLARRIFGEFSKKDVKTVFRKGTGEQRLLLATAHRILAIDRKKKDLRETLGENFMLALEHLLSAFGNPPSDIFNGLLKELGIPPLDED